MRLFIGVWLPEVLRAEVRALVEQIAPNCSGWKWTGLENLHFTLKFLGEVGVERVADLKQVLEEVANGVNEFPLKLGTPGVFPNQIQPRVLWLGIKTGDFQLKNLAGMVETVCGSIGFAREVKAFKAHLTIARAKGEPGTFNITENYPMFKNEVIIEGFSLIESQLLPKGPVYRSLQDFKFRNG